MCLHLFSNTYIPKWSTSEKWDKSFVSDENSISPTQPFLIVLYNNWSVKASIVIKVEVEAAATIEAK